MRLKTAAVVFTFALGFGAFGAIAATKAPLKLAFVKCGHCIAMGMMPEMAPQLALDMLPMTNGNDALTALVSKSVDVAQVTYQHYVISLDKGFDVVAITGQVNGGSEIFSPPGSSLKADDWAALRAVIAERKKKGDLFRIGAGRGTAQDLHMRGEFALNGIDVNKDVQFINIPNPNEHTGALVRGEIDMLATVEPFATVARRAGATHFNYPYKQASGNLTNLIMTRSDVVKDRPDDLRAVVAGVVKMVGVLKADRSGWAALITKYTGIDKSLANEALKNAYPDYLMHRNQTQAIATMMRDLKYISHDVSAKVDKNMDFEFLEAVTGKSEKDLGG
jgi:ABC-type nitrate/sulfonate/bicarbonate transport system substrate-binding protein